MINEHSEMLKTEKLFSVMLSPNGRKYLIALELNGKSHVSQSKIGNNHLRGSEITKLSNILRSKIKISYIP